MELIELIDIIRKKAKESGEILEPSASQAQLDKINQILQSRYSIFLPNDYCDFLKLVNGIECNGMIFYGTKNSETDPDGSELDIVELNGIFQETMVNTGNKQILIEESSTGTFIYNGDIKKYQNRDRIGSDRVISYNSFFELFEEQVSKVTKPL